MSNIALLLLLFPGRDYLDQHDFREAARYYRLISSIAPSSDATYNRGICALANGEVQKCVNLLNRLPNKDDDVYYYLGVADYQLGLYDEAKSNLERFSKENKPPGQIDFYMGLINLKQKAVVAAAQYFSLMPQSQVKNWFLDYIANYNRLLDARIAFREDKYNEALKLYEQTSNFFGYKEFGLALCLARMDDPKKSLALLDTIINHAHNRPLINQAMIEAARISLDAKSCSRARTYLREYLAITTDDQAYLLLGQAFNNEAQYDSAAYYFNLLPDSLDEYLFYKGRANYFLGQWGRAEEELLRHRELFPNSIYGDRATHIIASINFKRQEYKAAIDFWQELIARYPQSTYAAVAMQSIGDAYFNMGKYRRALKAYQKVQTYKPLPEVIEATALKIYETRYFLHKYPSLIEALRSFIEDHPHYESVPRVRLRLAKILAENKEYYHSLAELEKIIEDNPDGPITNEALIEKARICDIIDDRPEMINSLHHLLAQANGGKYNSYAVNELATIYLKEAKYDSALYYDNRLLDFDDYRERALLEIAKIYDLLEQNNAAATVLDRLITEYPSSVFLFDAYILKAKAYKKQGDYKNAINILNELIEKTGPKPEVYVEIGNVYFELEEYPNARDNYLIASALFAQKRDDAARTLLLAGDAAMAIGDKKSGHEYYLRASLIAQSLSLKNQASAKLSVITEE